MFLQCILILLISLTITVFFEKMLLPILSSCAEQPIYEEGPTWHIQKKGTPTMGGIAFVAAIVLTLSPYSLYLINSPGFNAGISIIITLLFSLGNGLIGVFDDLTKLHRKENAGLSPLQKLGLQLILAIIFLMARKHFFSDSTVLSFAFGSIDIGFVYYPFAIIVLLGIVNCANLTDGIDGLASSVACAIGLFFAIISCATIPETAFLSFALIGGTIGFLLFNKHPAKIFMGDTGSLFLGAITAGLAFSIGNPVVIIPVGAVYVIEGVSVILQVASFKIFRKRIFKMAPLHHHLEKCGLSENKICLLGITVTLLTSVLSLFVFKIL